MTESYYRIIPHDPLMARDGRPITEESRMRSVDWLYPSVVSGSFRTFLGKALNQSFDDPAVLQALKNIEVAGIFPVDDSTLYLPTPKDLLRVRVSESYQIIPLRPLKNLPAGGGCNLPTSTLSPIDINDESKPDPFPPFLGMNDYVKWLSDPLGNKFQTDQTKQITEKEERTHIKMDLRSGSALEGQLFSTTGLRFKEGVSLSTRIVLNGCTIKCPTGMHPLGGERRLASWQIQNNPPEGWICPKQILQAVEGKKFLRMVLTTPALFSDGWKPGWLNENLEGSLPQYASVKLKLISAIVDRWKPVSGWSYETKKPKAIRRLAPQGSVYFFEVLQGDPQKFVEKMWLRSVCDDQQDCRDGFGLAVWGVWDYLKNN